MKVKEGSIASHILEALFLAEDLTPLIFKSPHTWARAALYGNFNSYRSSVSRLKRKGLINIVLRNGEKYLQLTKKGNLDALFIKARIPTKTEWDGKWRVIIFDIPEGAKDQRDQLRHLLKKNGYQKLQASVYINPYPLSREAIAYVKETGLIRYIRILRIDDMDEDRDLRKKFGI